MIKAWGFKFAPLQEDMSLAEKDKTSAYVCNLQLFFFCLFPFFSLFFVGMRSIKHYVNSKLIVLGT